MKPLIPAMFCGGPLDGKFKMVPDSRVLKVTLAGKPTIYRRQKGGVYVEQTKWVVK